MFKNPLLKERITMFRIFTEDLNRNKIIDTLARQFSGFAIIPVIGFWKGEREDGLTIEIVTANFRNDVVKVRQICREIKVFNNQDAVLYQYIDGIQGEYI